MYKCVRGYQMPIKKEIYENFVYVVKYFREDACGDEVESEPFLVIAKDRETAEKLATEYIDSVYFFYRYEITPVKEVYDWNSYVREFRDTYENAPVNLGVYDEVVVPVQQPEQAAA